MSANRSINFLRGWISHDLLPRQQIIKATTELLKPELREYDDDVENHHPLVYGADSGSLWVREEICKFTNDAFKLEADNLTKSKPEYINLTSGASYGMLNLLLQTTLPHTGYTRQAFVISPTYFLINDAFIDAGFRNKITAIREKDDGIDLDTLQKHLEYYEKLDKERDHSQDSQLVNSPNKRSKKLYRFVIYLIPTYSNPSGKTYSLSSRNKLIELARKHDMLIITDDVYDMLSYDQPATETPRPTLRFTHLDRATLSDVDKSYGNTIVNTTFSKMIAPGLRFGYQETVNSNLATQLSQGGANASGGTPSQLNSMIVGTMLRNGDCAKIIRQTREALGARCEVLYDSIKKYLPQRTEYELQTGGYFSWCTLPEGFDSGEICETLKRKYNVMIPDGSRFEVVDNPMQWKKRSVRLSVSYLSSEDIEKAVELWGQVCRQYAKEHHLEF
ncbi:LANO_0F03466g1_1 [Lachancea nothofagi CBS 11611]|uniref:LANO_0F03466g1_1 n=1 Tax=Lachancea nothofagi CBS 11611 TaxID=1266666 RepID=A0A1G4K747_9SACH|nr:LANO_0F03466g1_1 [Lachancea nothofagi CBS 11611]